jgi:hypothetical protein
MKTKILLTGIPVLLAALSLGQKANDEKKEISAYITKVVRDVQVKTPSGDWEKVNRTRTLKSGYEVKTQPKSLAVILFADESKLILREKSIATIKGQVRGKEILDRSVHVNQGSMIFNVKKGEREQFRFSSPISVASIRGTRGLLNTHASVDSFTIYDGLAELTNSLSGKKGTVGPGQTAVSDSSGNFRIAKADDRTLNEILDGGQSGGEGGTPEDSSSESGIGPHFGQLKSQHPGTVRVNLASFEGTAVSALLFCRKLNEKEFTELPLEITGQIAKGGIPERLVKFPALEYYLVIKLKSGTVVMIPEGGSSDPASVKVAPYQRILRIPGQTGSLQKKVIELKWDE